MTSNQLKLLEIRENVRANKAREENEAYKSGETRRSNVVKEIETNRHNLAEEQIGRDTNATSVIVAETNRKAKREAAWIKAGGQVVGKLLG